ncbi:hypothetical protein [Pseudogulbenkiania sp. MAI-1]|uniref:hypothetical protein n=1 Tax=Pseudogulbenkiania sp. MAI-1 TaxID=990370 RepID=UPI00045E93C1|nr:hypothetical protein [Pseudogulbenkiania sp. MAI-1]
MKKPFAGALMLALGLAQAAHATDDRKMFPIEEALNSAEAQQKLDPEIKLYFGDQKHPKGKVLGEWVANKKTNAFNKDAKTACEWAFLSAALEFQERARKEGGNAVINIRSFYKQEEISSDKEYMCGSGFLMAGVAFKAQVIKTR